MGKPVVAALDLGSNTFRLMLAAPAEPGRAGAGGPWADKQVFQHIPRLSENLIPGGCFAPGALERAWAALDDFDGHIRAAGAGRVLAGATMAARLAADGPELMAAVGRRYGWEAVILSGQEEAGLTAAGVLTGLAPRPGRSLIFDIGGRSTEFISAAGSEIVRTRSLPLGVVLLTEEFLQAGRADGESQLDKIAEAAREALRAADFSDLKPWAAEGFSLVGTAGTVTTMAALLLKLKTYDPARVNNARLERPAVAALLAELAPLTVAERVAGYGLHPRRADAITAGLALVLEIMDYFGRADLVVSDNGLLEGVWLRAASLM